MATGESMAEVRVGGEEKIHGKTKKAVTTMCQSVETKKSATILQITPRGFIFFLCFPALRDAITAPAMSAENDRRFCALIVVIT